MKKIFILSVFFCFVSLTSKAQTSEGYNMFQFIVGGNHSLQIVGDDSKSFVDSLFANYPKTKRKGYIWKFKNVVIPGLEDPVTLQVHQGLYGEDVINENDSNKCKNGFYFTTFTSEKYKQYRLENKKPTEQDAITIYIREGRNYGLSNKEDAEIVEAFLQAMYES